MYMNNTIYAKDQILAYIQIKETPLSFSIHKISPE